MSKESTDPKKFCRHAKEPATYRAKLARKEERRRKYEEKRVERVRALEAQREKEKRDSERRKKIHGHTVREMSTEQNLLIDNGFKKAKKPGLVLIIKD
jgi:hypothetical protein